MHNDIDRLDTTAVPAGANTTTAAASGSNSLQGSAIREIDYATWMPEQISSHLQTAGVFKVRDFAYEPPLRRQRSTPALEKTSSSATAIQPPAALPTPNPSPPRLRRRLERTGSTWGSGILPLERIGSMRSQILPGTVYTKEPAAMEIPSGDVTPPLSPVARTTLAHVVAMGAEGTPPPSSSSPMMTPPPSPGAGPSMRRMSSSADIRLSLRVSLQTSLKRKRAQSTLSLNDLDFELRDRTVEKRRAFNTAGTV